METYSTFCLKNPMDRGAWWATVQWGCKDSDTTKVTQHTCTYIPNTEKLAWVRDGLQEASNHSVNPLHKFSYFCTNLLLYSLFIYDF